jgi:hypothetical protein
VSEAPRTQYAKIGELHLAHQFIGDGPLDVLVMSGYFRSTASTTSRRWLDSNVLALMNPTVGKVPRRRRLSLQPYRPSGLSQVCFRAQRGKKHNLCTARGARS